MGQPSLNGDCAVEGQMGQMHEAASIQAADDLLAYPRSRHFPGRAAGDEAPRAGAAAWLAGDPLPNRPADVAIRDLEDLLDAVKIRLSQTAELLGAEGSEQQRHDTADRVRTNILECVVALDQLHTTVVHELGRRQQLELEVSDRQAALERARAELAGTRAEEMRARHLALHDALTSLPNRAFFRERLDHALTVAEPGRRPLALLYLDLDGFKPINDTHGHDTGDELLRIVAARLSHSVRAEDMVSRVGGDEFACLLGGVPSREHLIQMARKVFDAVAAPVKLGKLEFRVRPSIGIANCPADGDTAEVLLKHADAAMYRAKREKTGHAFFDEPVNACASQAE